MFRFLVNIGGDVTLLKQLLHQREDGAVRSAEAFVKRESFPFKPFQCFGAFDPVFQDISCHFSPAHLGIDNDGRGFPVFHDIELGCDDLHFAAYPIPVEKLFHFSAGQIDQYASLLFDFADKIIGEQRLPVVEHRQVSCFCQFHVPFKPVVLDAVQRAQQSVEKRCDEQVVLREKKVFFREIRWADALEYDSRIRSQSRKRFSKRGTDVPGVCILLRAVIVLAHEMNVIISGISFNVKTVYKDKPPAGYFCVFG